MILRTNFPIFRLKQKHWILPVPTSFTVVAYPGCPSILLVTCCCFVSACVCILRVLYLSVLYTVHHLRIHSDNTSVKFMSWSEPERKCCRCLSPGSRPWRALQASPAQQSPHFLREEQAMSTSGGACSDLQSAPVHSPSTQLHLPALQQGRTEQRVEQIWPAHRFRFIQLQNRIHASDSLDLTILYTFYTYRRTGNY